MKDAHNQTYHLAANHGLLLIILISISKLMGCFIADSLYTGWSKSEIDITATG
jgi:hypothetical protein